MSYVEYSIYEQVPKNLKFHLYPKIYESIDTKILNMVDAATSFICISTFIFNLLNINPNYKNKPMTKLLNKLLNALNRSYIIIIIINFNLDVSLTIFVDKKYTKYSSPTISKLIKFNDQNSNAYYVDMKKIKYGKHGFYKSQFVRVDNEVLLGGPSLDLKDYYSVDN